MNETDKSEKLISVLMSVYKEPVDYFKSALESVLNQTHKNIQLILIVDCPENDDVINFAKTTAISDMRLEIHVNEKNIGLVKSLNKALSFVRGDYIARMDADDISDLTRFEKELDFLEDNRLDLVGCNYRLFSDDSILHTTDLPLGDLEIKNSLRNYQCVPHPSWLAKKEVYEKLCGYRDVSCCEDYDFLIRAANCGFKFGNLSQPLLDYRFNSNSISRTNEVKQKIVSRFLRKKFDTGYEIDELYEYLESDAYLNEYESLNKWYGIKESFRLARTKKDLIGMIKYLFMYGFNKHTYEKDLH